MSPLVDAIASIPGLAAKLMAQHRDDGTGHCVRCPIGGQAGWKVWPCNLYTIAESAEQERGTGGGAPPAQ